MSKKIMLLALAAVSAAMFALPAAALAAWETDPAGVSFTGTTTKTSSVTGTNEPTITCEGPDHITGSYDATSKTTGTIALDFTACHISLFGFTVACTTGASGNTISSGGTFHNVINGTRTELQITLTPTTIKCGSSNPITLTGTVNGTVTSPACSTPSTTATIEFANAGGILYETEPPNSPFAGTLTTHATLVFAQTMTKTC